MAEKKEIKSTVTTRKFNLQKLFAVLLVIISLVGIIGTKGFMIWSLFFAGGIAWFVILRILKD